MTIYHDHILDHYHHPRNHGKLSKATHTSDAHNTSCGDHITISFIISDDIITAISFDGDGCAISQAAASILTEHIKNKPTDVLRTMNAKNMLELLQIPCSPARIKCALLALETAQKAVNNTIH